LINIIIKPYYCLFLALFFIQGCSSLNNISNNAAAQENNPSLSSTQEVLQSTQEILQAAPPLTQISINQQIDTYLSGNNKKSEYNDVWLRLPELYQLSDIDNKRIQRQEQWFLKHKKHIEDTSKRAAPFLYFITEEVSKRNMPGEIALLPVIESSFRSNVFSRAKAAGLWQFVPATGRYFGLKQNWWYDGRLDVYHSTLAALTYLQQLNKYYKGDWLLALAAYNVGAGNVNKAIKRNRKKGKPVDYWSLSLPKETYQYVPKLLAISRIIKNHQKLGISLSPIENSPRLMLVNTESQIGLSVVAKMADTSLDEIRTFNPAFKQWATDPDGPHHLLIPIDKVVGFEKQLALLDAKDRIQWYRHKIRSGESLSVIARRYKISVAALKKANHLKNNRIRAGKYLMVPSSDSSVVIAQTIIAAPQTASTGSNNYTVRKGDSFWKIARQFNMSHRVLASMNNLSPGDTLAIGQKLLISKKNVKDITLSAETEPASANMISYTVKPGDSLYTISRHFKVTINDLKRWNQSTLKKYLKPGQELKVYIIASS